MRRQFPQEQAAWLEDVFASLDAATLQSLRDAGTTYVLEEGDEVPEFQNALVRIEDGLLKLAVHTEDRRLTVALFGPKDTVCAPLFHPWDQSLYELRAQEQTEVSVIPQAAVLAVAATHPEFGASIMRQQSWGLWQLMQTVHMLAFYNLPQRVAQVLVNLATIFGIPDEKRGIKLGLRLTQEELAELAGARRETLSTVLQDFREDDILDLRYARIDIKDMAALRRMAGVDALPFLKPGRIDAIK
ncbi:MAG: Crp/Fnr family transcriptional regulator [Armatimonadetes bacterium]|jgi:CRP/FNR family transcriptional regulator|nr:Crp/Fnr family transcriptional regulator [Armatimonadota bacterium]